MNWSQALRLKIRPGPSPLWQLMSADDWQDCLPLIEELLELGYDPNEQWDMLEFGEWTREPETGSLHSEHDECILVPVHYAIFYGQLAVVELLLKFGADGNLPTTLGTTPLHEAIKMKSQGMLEVLLDHGINVETPMQGEEMSGFTALHLAVFMLHEPFTKSLLNKGADTQALTQSGWRPIHIALLERNIGLTSSLAHHAPIGLDPFARIGASSKSNRSYGGPYDRLRATHLLEFGVSYTSHEHRELFERLLSQTLELQAVKGNTTTYDITRLDNELFNLLKVCASRSVDVVPTNYCLQCDAFQQRDSMSLQNPYLHKNDFDSLSRSARNCNLCKHIKEALMINSSHNFFNYNEEIKVEELAAKPGVNLQVMKQGSVGRFVVAVGYRGTIGVLQLRAIDKCLHAAISTTKPNDDRYTQSERVIATAKAWIDYCDVCPSHSACRSARNTPLPTRVIDVGDELQKPKLLTTAGQQADYLALSYCWGQAKQTKTTRENLAEHHREIELAKLPETIRDAVLLTRQLCFRYLWIDALCIVQDSPEDFEREVTNMADIYAQASLTIAVSENDDCSQGIFNERSWRCNASVPLTLQLPDEFIETMAQRPLAKNRKMLFDNFAVSYYPQLRRRFRVCASARSGTTSERRYKQLDTRGWTLQEEVLSRRMLFCGKEEFSWRCLERKCSETDITLKPGHRDGRISTSAKSILTNATEDHGEQPEGHRIFHAWTRLVEDYTTRKLSNPRDKTIAILGLQKRFGQLLKDEPVAGLWKGHNFWRSLLWVSEGRTLRCSTDMTSFPSWSWASMDGPVSYSRFDMDRFSFLPRLERWNLQTIQYETRFVGGVTLKGFLLRDQDLLLNVEHFINSPYKIIRGEVEDFETEEDKHPIDTEMYPIRMSKTRMDVDESWDEANAWYLLLADRAFEPQPQSTKSMHVTPKWYGGRPPSVIMMILEQLSPKTMQFRRVGITEAWELPQWRERAKEEVFELV